MTKREIRIAYIKTRFIFKLTGVSLTNTIKDKEKESVFDLSRYSDFEKYYIKRFEDFDYTEIERLDNFFSDILEGFDDINIIKTLVVDDVLKKLGIK